MAKVQILIVEDDNIVVMELRDRLQSLGYAVAAVVSYGEEAIKKAAETRPDLVLMDIRLKGAIDGVEAAEEIRARFDIPVVYLTAYADEDTLQRAKITEPYGYIIKPFEERELHTAIDMALYKHRMERKLKESERWLAITLRSIGDAVIATDKKGLVTFMNPIAEALTAWKQEDALGRDLTEVFKIVGEETGIIAESPVTKALREGVIVGLANHSILIAKDGTETPIDNSAAPIRDDKGKVIGVVLVFRDITERKRTEEEIQQRALQLEALSEVSRVVSSTLDLDTVLQLVLEQLARVIPYDSIALWLRSEDTLYVAAARGFPNMEEILKLSVKVEDNSLFQAIEREKGPLVIADTHQDSRFLALGETDYVCSWIGVPLMVKGEVIGTITIDKWEPHFYHKGHAQMAVTFANQAAIAIENARLFGETKRHFEETTALYQTSLDITVQLEMSELLKSIVERAVTLLRAEAGGIYLYDPEREELRLAIGYGYTEEYVGVALKPGEGMAGKVFQTGEPLIVDDYRTWEGRAIVFEADQPFSAVLEVPLKWQDRIIGVLAIDADARKRTFNQDDVWLATLFANQAAVAIENARIYEEERKRVTQLELIGGITQKIASILDLDELLPQVARMIGDTFGYYYTSILLVEAGSDELIMRAGAGPFSETLIGLRLKIGREGISGWVAHSGEPLLVNDVSREPRYYFVEESKDTRSELAVPIKRKGEIIGVLDVQSVELDAFGQDDVSILQTLADQLAIAIENAQLYEKVTERMREATVLHRVSGTLMRTLNLDQLLESIIEVLQRSFGYLHCAILLLDEETTEELYVKAACGYLQATAKGLRIKIGQEGITGWVAANRVPLNVPDVTKDDRYVEGIKGTRSEIAVPMLVGDKLLGLLDVQSTEVNAFGEDDLRTLSSIAAQTAIAIERARLYGAEAQRRQEAETLRQAAMALTSTLDLEEALDRILEQLHRVVAYDSASVQLLRDDHLEIVGGRGFADPSAVIGLRFPVPGDNPNTRVIESGGPVILADAQAAHAPFRELPHDHIRSWLGIPMRFREQTIGLITLDSTELGHFTADHARLAAAFANQAAVAIENARLYEQTTAMAAELEVRVQERTEELAHKAQELSFLYQASVALSSSLDMEEVLVALAQQAALAMDAVDWTICELQDDALVVVASACDPALPWQDPELRRRYLLADYPATREAIEKGQPLRVRVDDPLADEAERAKLEEFGYTALLQVQIVSRDRVVGIVEVFDNKPEREFSEGDAALLQTIANQAGMAVERARLFQQVREERNRLELLYEVSRKLSASLDLDQTLYDIFQVSVAATGASRGSIFVFDDEGRVSHCTLMRDLSPAEADGAIDRVLRRGLAGWVLEHKQPAIVFDTNQDERWLPFPDDPEPVGSAMVIPFIERDRVRGLLTLVHPQPSHFNQAHLELLSSIAQQVAVVIERARLHERARHRAVQLATAAEVSRDATSILDVGQLLTGTVDLIRDRFDLYYAGIFLVDEAGGYAVLQAGTGEAGQQMLKQGHKLQVGGASVVGQCVATAKACITLDVGKEAIRFENPLLPETRSEMALPLISRGRVIGAMIIQSDRPAVFSEEDITALQTLADQLANAIENARLYEETHRRAQEVAQQKEQTDAIVQSMADGLIVTDLENRLVLANPAAEELLKFRLKDAIGQDIGANIRDDRLRQTVRDTLDKRQPGYEMDIELTDPYDGAQRIVRAHTAVVNDPFGQSVGIVTTLRDVTHEREVQRLKDELVSTVSHELRTPMTSVLGFSELLVTRQLSEEKRQLYAQTIHKEAQRLSALINDFLDIQRMERGQQEYHFEEVDLGELAREAVAIYSGQSEAHTLTLDLPSDLPIVQADPDRLRQVLGNLLSNAIKFSPGGGTVTVSVQAEGDEIHVAVSDEGVGIPAEAMPHLFEKFFRVDSSDRREIQGTGLGLAICKGIVEAHRGRIWTESQVGTGTTVIFSLPVTTRKRILVIDDEKDIREMFQRLLSERDYEVLTAANGQEGLSLMEVELPDLVILDIAMPVMNGYQFLEKVNGDRRTKDIPVIAISGVDTDIDRLKELGMDEFLSKPFSSTVLLETMERLLKGS